MKQRGMNHRKGESVKTYSSCMLVLCLLFSFINGPILVQASQEVSQQTVRVGFFEAEGYHVMDSEGTMSGYGYDFLQMLLRYNDWNYEYVGYDQNWGDMLDMLENGKIDMVTLANKTPERLEKFDFSAETIGTSATVMTMKSANERIIIGDYATYDGARVGLVEGSSHNEKFQEYAAEKGFSYTPVYYDDINELLTDLREGQNIDIAVTSNMRQIKNEVILEEFNATEYYAIVKKGNEQLLGQLDNAVRQLDVYSQDWRNTLFQKYYANINDKAIALSVEERQYINDLKTNGTVIKAAMNPELKPYSYVENGQAKGIAPRIFEEIAARLGIKYEILPSTSRREYKEQLQSGEADIDLTAYLDYSLGQKYNLKETDAYMTSAIAMLTRKDSNTDSKTMLVASVENPTEYIGYNQDLIYRFNHIEYTSIQECIDAVKNGEADATFRYVYIAQQAVANDYKNQLQYSILQDRTFGLCIGVINSEDHRLLSILNKSVNSITKTFSDGIILEETTELDRDTSLHAFVYANPNAVIMAVTVLLMFLFLILLFSIRYRTQKQKLLSSFEFKRFVGYVCESNEIVEEIDLKNQQKKVYEIKDGALVSKIVAYQPYSEDYFKDRVHPEEFAMIVNAFSDETITQMIDTGVMEQYFEARMKNKQGEYIWYSYIIKAIPKDAGHPKNFIVFKKNIQQNKREEAQRNQTLRDALESAQKASLAKGLFVSKISHEIRTPLNAIIGYLNMAQEMEENKKQVEHCILNCKSASAHLLDLINDVLDLSAIESSKLKIAYEEFDFKELLTTICTIYYSQAEQKGSRFEIDIHNLTEEWVVGDALRVKQILMNLLSNAVKFSRENGSIHLIVEQVTQTDTQTHIRFQVKDNGIGMEQGFTEHIFEPFEQENTKIAQSYGGSGLGLSITRNLVDMMEGSISVASQKDVGTTFTVLIPFGRSSHETINEPAYIEAFHKVRILVVESNEQAADYIKSLLKRCHVKCDIADSGEKALKRISGRKGTEYEYDICLVDWTAAELDGARVTQAIVEQDKEAHPNMVAITYDITEIEKQAEQLGIRNIIEKPLFQSSLFDMLMEMYGCREHNQEVVTKDESLKGTTLLLVEDNEMNMEIAKHILTKAGIHVEKAENGQIACEKFLRTAPGTYQAILMDIQMPVMDGYEAARKIRASNHPQAKQIPIIALTANAFAEDVSKALNAGMNDHISKPIDALKLYQILRKHI